MRKNLKDFLFFSYETASNKIYREVYMPKNKNITIYIIWIIAITANIKAILKFNFYKLYCQAIFVKRINNKV